VAAVKKEEVPVFQEPAVTHEQEQQHPLIHDVPDDEPSRRLQKARRSAISDYYEVYVSKGI
jgi:hypothetical protein